MRLSSAHRLYAGLPGEQTTEQPFRLPERVLLTKQLDRWQQQAICMLVLIPNLFDNSRHGSRVLLLSEHCTAAT
jgi:hypothetical protein